MGDLNGLVTAEAERALSDPAGLRGHLLRLIEGRERLAEAIRSRDREIEALAPAKDFYDRVASSAGWMEMAAAVKALAYKGWGRNNVFALLRDREILRYNNEPYQEYVDRGIFKTIEEAYEDAYGRTKVYRKTMASQKGLDFIRKLIEAEEGAK